MRIGKIIHSMFFDIFKDLNLGYELVQRNISALSASIVRGPMIYTEKVFYDLFSSEYNFRGFGSKPSTDKKSYHKQLQNTINLMNSGSELKVSSKTFISAVKRTKMQLGIASKTLKPCQPQEAADALESSSSSGFYYIFKKHTVRDKLASDANRILRNKSDESWLAYPSYIATKQQIRGMLSGLKTRLIFVFPGVVSTLENMFVVPLTTRLTELNNSTCLATGKVFHQIREHHLHLSRNYSTLVGFDFSAFDQHVQKQLIHAAFFILKDCFKMDEFESALFDKLVYYFTDGPILIRSERGPIILKSRKRGIPSGSGFTSIVGSIVNLIMINCFLIDNGYINESDFNQIQVLGDDSLLGINVNRSHVGSVLKKASSYFKTCFDAEMNPDKCDIARRFDRIYYLGYDIDYKYRYLNTERAMLQLMYSSREIRGLSLTERVFSKLCGICFKCYDGKKFFFRVWSRLKKYLDFQGQLPEFYYDLKDARSPSDFESISEAVKNKYARSVTEMMDFGYLIQ